MKRYPFRLDRISTLSLLVGVSECNECGSRQSARATGGIPEVPVRGKSSPDASRWEPLFSARADLVWVRSGCPTSGARRSGWLTWKRSAGTGRAERPYVQPPVTKVGYRWSRTQVRDGQSDRNGSASPKDARYRARPLNVGYVLHSRLKSAATAYARGQIKSSAKPRLLRTRGKQYLLTWRTA